MCCGGTVTEFNTKRWHTAARCSVLTFSWRGLQTRLDTSGNTPQLVVMNRDKDKGQGSLPWFTPLLKSSKCN
jgi:hypothetical protein